MVSIHTNSFPLKGTIILQTRRTILILHALGASSLPCVAHQVIRALWVLLWGRNIAFREWLTWSTWQGDHGSHVVAPIEEASIKFKKPQIKDRRSINFIMTYEKCWGAVWGGFNSVVITFDRDTQVKIHESWFSWKYTLYEDWKLGVDDWPLIRDVCAVHTVLSP